MSLVDAIPQTIKEIGRINAEARLRSGLRTGALVGGIGEMIGSIPARERQRKQQERAERSQAMQETIQALQLQRAQRQQMAEEALQGAMSTALNPDGSVDHLKFTQALAGTPAVSLLPQVLEGFNKLQRSQLDLQGAKLDAAEAEDDALGALAHAADQLPEADHKAGTLLTGLASGVKLGTVRSARANELIAAMLGDDGNPIPDQVAGTIKALTAKSSKQRALAASDAQKEAAAASAKALAEDRTADTAREKFATSLGNYSRQLAATKSQARYAQVFAGIPPEFRSYFDDPADWTEQSAENAGLALATPADRIRLKGEQRQADAQRQQLDVSRGNLDVSRGRLKLDQEKEQHDEDDAKATGAQSRAELTQYKDFTTRYERARDEERQRAPRGYDADGNTIIRAPQYQPPPSIEKWRAMTPQERQQVITSPDQRIDDAEMARRGGSALSTQPTSTAPAPAAATPATTPAPTKQWKVGDVVYYQGKKMVVSGHNPDGSVRVKPADAPTK
jgi:hypothetical protein